MGKVQTKDSRYPSRYSPGAFVRADQYIIELVCEQAARKKKKDLPIKFWNLPEWKLLFLSQLRAVRCLLKKYSVKAIITTVQEKKYDSIRPKWVEEDIKQKQIELDTVKPVANFIPTYPDLRTQEIKIPEKRIVPNKLNRLDE